MIMKKLVLLALLSFFICPFANGHMKKKGYEPYKFETIIKNPITPIKDQSSSGTCWCFSGLSFIESEILRATGEEYDLSEMFVVSNAYYDKALKYVRLHGNLNFGPGSCFNDVMTVLKEYGIVPEHIMPGLNYGTTQHVHFEMDEILKAVVSVIVKNPNKKITPAWKKGFRNMTAAYLGEIPDTFVENGKKYTPKSYMEGLGINLDNYIDISSWTYSPFYESMYYDVPDNWRGIMTMNVPIDDIITIIDNAIDYGYTVAWASDVSEDGFTSTGIGVVPDMAKVKKGSDAAHWLGDTIDSSLPIYALTPCPELKVTQKMRQDAFDDYSTTDDHGMHIYGKAKDQNGTEYYMVKNSWGIVGPYNGVWYVSKEYVRYKTTNILVNKKAIPEAIARKMNL